MSIFASPRFLRNVLRADAAAGAASSLLHLLAAGFLSQLFGLPYGVVALSGAALLLYVAAAVYLALCDPIPRRLVAVLIAGNWAWVGACAVVFMTYAGAMTSLGQAYLVIHGLAVAVLAELQWFGLRRAPRVGWA
jgi:hypothetical protein